MSNTYPRPQLGDSTSFNRYFTLESRIVLSNEKLIGSISHLDVHEESGKIAVTDGLGKTVLLFNVKGEYLTELTLEQCFPGVNWNPRASIFKQNGDIGVINSGSGLFYFSNSGECLEGFSNYLPPRFVDFDSEGNIWGVRARVDKYSVEVASGSGGAGKETFSGTVLKNIFSRVATGGLVVDRHDNVFVSFPYDPSVYRYQSDSGLIQKMGPVPSYFRPIQEDITDTENLEGRSALRKIAEITSDKTQMFSIKMLNDTTIVALYLNKYNIPGRIDESLGISVFTTDGEPVINEEILTSGDNMFWATSGGYGYSISRPVSQEVTESNPGIIVFRFKGAE